MGLLQIQRRLQIVIGDNLIRQNCKHRDCNYAVGQEVLVKTVNPAKLESRSYGPYWIEQVYINETIDVLRRANVVERIYTRKAVPFYYHLLIVKRNFRVNLQYNSLREVKVCIVMVAKSAIMIKEGPGLWVYSSVFITREPNLVQDAPY